MHDRKKGSREIRRLGEGEDRCAQEKGKRKEWGCELEAR